MTSPKSMDELFWEQEFEGVIDWIERLEMVVKVQNYDEAKFYKIDHFNLTSKAKEWCKHIEPSLANWAALKVSMKQKYGVVDLEKIIVRLDVVKQKPRQWV